MTMCPDLPETDPWIGPYLENPGPYSMTITWIRRESTRCTLTVKATGESERSYPVTPSSRIGPNHDRLYRVRLDGLTPDTRYAYTLHGTGAGALEASFRTFPEASTRITFIYYGDNKSSVAMHETVASRFLQHAPLFIMHSGDMTEHGGYAEYRPYFFYPLRNVINHIPLYPARGNHEGNGQAYRELFDLPNGQPWYAFDCGPVHGIVLDTTGWRHRNQHKDIPVMRAWLDADLKRPRLPWTLAMYHEPSYDLGWRKDDWGREEFLPLLRRGGTDLTLSGHAHGYQRLHPMIAKGENERRPITHIISAGAGAPIGTRPLDPSPFLAAEARSFNYLVFVAEPERLNIHVLSENDTEIDSFELRKPAGHYELPFIKQAMVESRYPDGKGDHTGKT